MTRKEFINLYRTKRKYMKKDKDFSKSFRTGFSMGMLSVALSANIISFDTYARLADKA